MHRDYQDWPQKSYPVDPVILSRQTFALVLIPVGCSGNTFARPEKYIEMFICIYYIRLSPQSPQESGKLWRPLLLESCAAPGFRLCANPRFRFSRALILLEPRRASNQVDIVILSLIYFGCFGIMSARPEKYNKMLINILCAFQRKAPKSVKFWHPLMLGGGDTRPQYEKKRM
jgi:hypothetical protein